MSNNWARRTLPSPGLRERTTFRPDRESPGGSRERRSATTSPAAAGHATHTHPTVHLLLAHLVASHQRAHSLTASDTNVGLATANLATTVIGTSTAVASALMLAPRCERQIRARRAFDTTDHPWVLSDVATEPHQGIGDQLINQIGIRADEAAVDVVLTVGASNQTARTLYTRHGFHENHERDGKIAMQRLASPHRSAEFSRAVRTPMRRLLPRDQTAAVSVPSSRAFDLDDNHDSIPPSSTHF